MHCLHLLLTSSFVFSTVLASRSIHARQEALSEESTYINIVPRGSSRGSSPDKDPGRGSASSSQPKRQKSPDLAEQSRGSSSSVQATSSISRERSLSQAVPSTSRGRSPPPSGSAALGNQGLYSGTASVTRNGPMRIPRSQVRRISTAHGANRPTSPEPQHPVPSGIISGHPNSVMVVAKGPAYLEAQKSTGDKEITHVPAGRYDYIHMEDKVGGYALARPGDGGHATAASTGNSVAAFASVGRFANGFIESYNGPTESFTRVHPGTDERLHVKGDGSGKVRGAALAYIQGRGQVTAVALEKEKDSPPVKTSY